MRPGPDNRLERGSPPASAREGSEGNMTQHASLRGRPSATGSPTTVDPGRQATEDLRRFESELLGRLGLGSDSTHEQLEATHDAVVEYLAAAPRGLRGWARAQAATVDEAFALLSDPAALARSAALAGSSRRPAAGHVEPTIAPAPVAPPPGAARRPRRNAPDVAESLSDDELDDLIAEVTPSAHRDEVAHPHGATLRSEPGAMPGHRRLLRPALAIAGLAAAVVIGVVIYNAGAPSVSAAIGATPSASSSPVLDQAEVSALMTRIQANPKDTDALMSLGDAFFQAGQYAVSADWLTRLVAIDGTNVRALLALGAAQFNAADPTNAEKQWKRVVELDAKNVEAHYDLGFLYLQEQPPDLVGVRREWQLVVQLAPGTEVAQNVQAHLDAIASASPSASAGAASVAATPTVAATPPLTPAPSVQP